MMDTTLSMELPAIGETVLSTADPLSATPDTELVGGDEELLAPRVDEGVHQMDTSAQPILPYGSWDCTECNQLALLLGARPEPLAGFM